MMLTEVTSVLSADLPVQALKDHLRLGTGFSDGNMQDALIESYLRAALSAIEGRTGKALMQRRFRLVLEDWRDGSEQTLPVAPVSAIVAVTLFDVVNAATVLDTTTYRLVVDTQRPKLAAVGYLHCAIVPTDGAGSGFCSMRGSMPPGPGFRPICSRKPGRCFCWPEPAILRAAQ